MHKQINQLIRVTPLIIVPRHQLDERRAQLNASLCIENRRARIRREIARNDVVLGVAQDALELAVGSRFHGSLDLVVRCFLGEADREVNDGDVGRGDAERHAGALVPPPVRPRWSRCSRNRRLPSWPPAGGRPPPKPCSPLRGCAWLEGGDFGNRARVNSRHADERVPSPDDLSYSPRMLEAKDILAAALKLNTRERAHLVDELSASLEGIDLGNEWEDEVQRRIDDIDAGRVNTVPGDVVFSRLEQRFGGR